MILSSDIREFQAIEIVQELLKSQKQLKAEPLVGGFSEASLIKVVGADQVYVVRFLDKLHEQWRQNEMTCQQIASDNGYGPHVYFTDREREIIVMEYLTPEAFPDDKNILKAYLDLVKKIHSGPAFPVTYSLFECTEECFKTIAVLGQNLIDMSKVTSIFNTIKQTIANFPHSAPCHRDLHINNVIYARKQFFAIDYTSAGQDDPYIDLAAPLFQPFIPAMSNTLFTEYLGRQPAEKELAKLSLMKSFVRMFYRTILVKGLPEALLQKTSFQEISLGSYHEITHQIVQGIFDIREPMNKLQFALAGFVDLIKEYKNEKFNYDKFNKEVFVLQEML